MICEMLSDLSRCAWKGKGGVTSKIKVWSFEHINCLLKHFSAFKKSCPLVLPTRNIELESLRTLAECWKLRKHVCFLLLVAFLFFLWFIFIHAPAKSIREASPKTTDVDWQIPCLQHQKFAASAAEKRDEVRSISLSGYAKLFQFHCSF